MTPKTIFDAPLSTRRELLLRGGAGFGTLALNWLLQQDSAKASPSAPDPSRPLAPRAPHFPAKAKRVIFLFMEGGPSHLDTFDPKPLLNRLAGRPIPASFRPVITPMGEFHSPILPSRRRWAQHGQSGLWVSDWLPHIAGCADDLAVLRSCWANGLNHSNGVCQMNTGSILAGRPSLGSWVTYGLGTENQNLPAFVVMQEGTGTVFNGPRNWGTGFMPAVYQGTRLSPGPTPIANLHPPANVSDAQQQGKIDLLNRFNRTHAATRPLQSELDARIASYELAFRMQAHAPEAVDLTQETEETKKFYGMDDPVTEPFARICLLGRRLLERGVRFVQLYHGAGSRWDAHSNIERNHTQNCGQTDKPVAALIKDLKRRGLLEDTLVIWGGEFGRTPMSEKGDGRDHNPYGFSMFLAGAGIQGGRALGSTDEAGLHAMEDRLHVHDLHATILHLLGIHHLQLTYRHQGRPENATMNEGEAYRKIVGG